MARLGDFATVCRTIGFGTLVRRVAFEVLDDHVLLFAGALAYAWLFAIFPFFIFLINLIPYLPGDGAARTAHALEVLVRTFLPDQAGAALWGSLQQQIDAAMANPTGGALSLSLLFTLWAASGGTTVTMAALDKCYELARVRSYIKRRPMAVALTLAVSGIIFGMFFLLPLTGMLQPRLRGFDPVVAFWLLWAFSVLRMCVAMALVLLIVGLIYHFGPCVKRKFQLVTPGAVFCLAVWVMLAMAFKAYVNHFDNGKYASTYGAAWWVVILLLFFYIDAVVLLVGAEINSEIEFEILKVPRGSRNFRIAERRPAVDEHEQEIA